MSSRRRMILGTLALALVLAAGALWSRRERARDEARAPESSWADDISEPEPAIAAPELEFARILELDGDSPDMPYWDESFAVFDRDYLWLSGLSELTRVPLDGGPIERISMEAGITPGTVGIVGDRVMWLDLGGEGTPAHLFGVSRSLEHAPEIVASLGRRWVTSRQRPLEVAGHVVLLGGLLDDESLVDATIAVVPMDGGEPRFHGLETIWCNEAGTLTSNGEAVVIACSRSDPWSAVYEIAIPSLERRVLRRVGEHPDDPWIPRYALRVRGSTILFGDSSDDGNVLVKRLRADARLGTITSLGGRLSASEMLRGDGQSVFYSCGEGECAGRLFWFGADGWAELPRLPRDAIRMDLSAGVLYWQRREGPLTVLYASSTWPHPPLQATASHNANGLFYGVERVRWAPSATP